MGVDPKPERRVRLSRAHYAKLSAEIMAAQGGKCACGCGRRAESLHHVIGGKDRSDVRENLVGLGGSGFTGCHGALTSRMRVWDNGFYIDPLAVAYGLRETMETSRPDVLAYIEAKKGREWLEKVYPRRPT